MADAIVAGNASAPRSTPHVGDQVRVRPGVVPSLGWGNVRSTSVGTVVRVDGDRCDVDFPGHANWHGKVPEIETLADPVVIVNTALLNAERGGMVGERLLEDARLKLAHVRKALAEKPLLDALAAVEASLALPGPDAGSSSALPPPTVTVSSTDGQHSVRLPLKAPAPKEPLCPAPTALLSPARPHRRPSPTRPIGHGPQGHSPRLCS